MMIDAEELARIREEGAIDGLRSSLRAQLTGVVWQVEQVTKKELVTLGDFRAAITGARKALENAEVLAEELDREGAAVVDNI